MPGIVAEGWTGHQVSIRRRFSWLGNTPSNNNNNSLTCLHRFPLACGWILSGLTCFFILVAVALHEDSAFGVSGQAFRGHNGVRGC